MPYEGRWRIKNLKSKGYKNCSTTEHELILTHFSENLNILIKLPSVFHILNRYLPQGTEI
jgi:hypothetical protein